MDNTDARFNFILRITTIIVIIIGLVGNFISFILFSRSPSFRKNSISIYSRALAIFDSFIIYQAIVNFYLILDNYYIGMYSDLTCKLIYYILYAFGSIPGWILIA